MSKMMRISDITARQLDDLTKMTGKSKQDIIAKAIDALARELFLKKTNQEYEQLKKDPKTWDQDCAALEEWDITLSDGLDIYD